MALYLGSNKKEILSGLPLTGGSGGSDFSEVPTCTIEIVNETIGTATESHLTELWFVAYVNGEYVKYSGRDGFDGSGNNLPADVGFASERVILNNVVCGSMMYIDDALGSINVAQDLYFNSALDNDLIFVPLTPGVTHTFKIAHPW